MIEFDEKKHEYYVHGRRLPSVSEILRPLYSDLRFVDADLLEYKGELGKAVHKAVELHALGTLDYTSLESPVVEYFEQYLKFVRDKGFNPVIAEVMVWSIMGYAGTFDLIGVMGGELVLIDIKTTAALSPAVALQTVAYAKAYMNIKSKNNTIKGRYALRLMPDGYRLHPYRNDAQDFAGFLGFLNAYKWCNANNKTIEGFNNVK